MLSFLLFYRVGDIMMFGMSKPFLRDIGVDTGHRGMLNGFSITASILGAIVGGAIIARKGLARCLVPMAYLQNLAIPLYILMAIVKPTFAGIFPSCWSSSSWRASAQMAFSRVSDAAMPRRRSRRRTSRSSPRSCAAVASVSGQISRVRSAPATRLPDVLHASAFVASVPSLVLVFFVPEDTRSKPTTAAETETAR